MLTKLFRSAKANKNTPRRRSRLQLSELGRRDVPSAPIVNPVGGIEINNGAVQRSTVSQIEVHFDQPVNLGTTPFDLENLTTNLHPIITVSGSGTSVATLNFSPGPSVNGISLADGRYTLRIIDPTKVTNGANQAMVSPFTYAPTYGPNQSYTLDAPHDIYRLFGDSTGVGYVSGTDLIQFRLNFGGTSPVFDYDGDGAVSAFDYLQFRLRNGGPNPSV